MEDVKPKPICIIYFPESFSWSKSGIVIAPIDLMKILNGWGPDNNQSRGDYDGYIWFCFFKEGITEPEFKVFYEKDYTKKQYKDLEELINKAIKEQP